MISPLRSDHASLWRRNVFLVARREILIRLRSRVFAGSTVVMVIIVAGGIGAASYLNVGRLGQGAAVHVAFSGGSQALEQMFMTTATALGERVTVTTVADASTGSAQVQSGTLDMAVSGSATAPTAVASESLSSLVEIALDAAAQNARLAASGLSPTAVASVTAPVPVQRVQPTGSSPRSQNALVGLAVGILLFFAIGMYGSFVAQGVVEEKATRIMEIILATIRPSELLAGKVIGIGLVALLQLGTVAAAALIAGGLTNAVSIPALGVVEVASYLALFLLGFLLFAAAYATVAALVSRQEEVASATAPVNIVLGGSYVLMYFSLANPTSPLSTVLSLVPPTAPIFMSVRIAEGSAEPWQVGLALALTGAAIVGLTWLAGRVYANSVMRIGARMRLLGPVAECLSVSVATEAADHSWSPNLARGPRAQGFRPQALRCIPRVTLAGRYGTFRPTEL
jgi:ABC-2 type transport system permease protein